MYIDWLWRSWLKLFHVLYVIHMCVTVPVGCPRIARKLIRRPIADLPWYTLDIVSYSTVHAFWRTTGPFHDGEYWTIARRQKNTPRA